MEAKKRYIEDPLDDLKTRLEGIKWVKEQLLEQGFVKDPEKPEDVHCFRITKYIDELDERCQELLNANFDLSNLDEEAKKEVVKHEDLINASLEKITNEHNDVYELFSEKK